MRYIAVIEDNADLSALVADRLNLDGFTKVSCFTSGITALNTLKKAPPQLVLVDLTLEDITGAEVIRELRKSYPNLPIIVMTGDHAKRSQIDLLNLGADDYITKPFDMDILVAKAQAKIRRTKTTAEPIGQDLVAGEIKMNLRDLVVSVAGDEVKLTATEFELLKYLLHNKNRLVSRTKILSSVWGYSTETNTRVVDVHIGNLRRKITKQGKPSPIESQRGFGYKLVAS